MAPDASLRNILQLIDEHGWAVVGVGGGHCSTPGCDGGPHDEIEFSYTVGLSTLGFPEVITYGLPQRVAQPCLNLIGERVAAGRRPRVGSTVGQVFEGCPGYLLEVWDTSDLVVVGQIYEEIAAVQLIWPDRQGRLPWQTGYDVRRYPQPLLGPAPGRGVNQTIGRGSHPGQRR